MTNREKLHELETLKNAAQAVYEKWLADILHKKANKEPITEGDNRMKGLLLWEYNDMLMKYTELFIYLTNHRNKLNDNYIEPPSK